VRIVLALILVASVAACSGGGESGSASSASSLNPFNWFGGRAATPGADGGALSLAPARGYAQVVDTRPLISQITALSAEKTAIGRIIRATGLAPAQGYHSAGLVAVASPKARELVFEFRARPPERPARIGPVGLRELVAGIHLTRAQLVGIRTVRIMAGQNNRSVRP
jgi:hypothetical protein